MSDKCGCQFCKDYKRFKEVLPLIPAEHQKWFESIFDGLWNAQEELSWKKHVLSGDDQESIETLEYYLAKAKRKQAAKETPVLFDCKVCEHCGKAMTAKEYWDHKCNEVGLVDEAHVCDVVDISDGPCGDVSHDEDGQPAEEKCGCGGNFVERTNSMTGHTFIGCSEFPECKYTKSGGSNPSPARGSFDYDEEDEEDPFYMGEHQGDWY